VCYHRPMLITRSYASDTPFSRRSLSELMAVYEGNYRRLLRLVPEPDRLPARAVSRVAGELDLHLQLVEQHAYTTILQLTYYFDDGRVADPAAQVRLYHDARLAEVESCRFRQPLLFTRFARPGVRLPVIEWKWEANLFLEKWLRYCLDHGHRFEADDLPGGFADALLLAGC